MKRDYKLTSQQHLAAGYEVVSILTEAKTIEDAAPKLLRVLAETLGWDAGILWRAEGEPTLLRALAWWTATGSGARTFIEASRSASYPPSQGLCGEVWRTRQAICSRDLTDDPRYQRRAAATAAGLRSVFLFPVVCAGEPHAVLEFLSRHPQEPDADLLRTMATIGFQIGQFVERIRTEQQLRQERDTLHRAFDQAPAAIAILRGPEFRYELSNPMNVRLSGGREMVGKTAREVFPELEAQGFPAILEQVYSTGQPFIGTEIPLSLRMPDGTSRDLSLNGMYQALFDTSGKVNGILVFGYDVTEMVRARQQAEEARASLALLADTIPQIIWSTAPDQQVEFFNRRWYEYTGLPPGDSAGKAWPAVCHPEDLPRLLDEWGQCVASGTPFQSEVRLLRASDRTYRWHLARSVPLKNSKGEIIKWIGSSTDIDNHKRTEEATRFIAEASALLGTSLDYRATLESVADLAAQQISDSCSIYLQSGDGPTVQHLVTSRRDPGRAPWAAEIERRFSPDPASSRGVNHVIRSGNAELYPGIPGDPAEANADDQEIPRALRAVGVTSVMIVPLRARERILGAIVFVAADSGRQYGERDLAVARDLCDRVAAAVDNARLYDEAEQAVRVRDDFLSVASHELRTPLTTLELQLETLRRTAARLDGPLATEKLQSALDGIGRQTRRLGGLVDDLLDVSRAVAGRFALELDWVDLARVAADAAGRVREQAQRAGCEILLRTDECRGHWDRMRLDQIVTNLVANAIKFGPGQPIAVEVLNSGDRAVLKVRDRGIGISPADQARIFERFERAVSGRHFGGLGLGLWIVRQIVLALGGSIAVESQPGRGAEFTVSLPRQ